MFTYLSAIYDRSGIGSILRIAMGHMTFLTCYAFSGIRPTCIFLVSSLKLQPIDRMSNVVAHPAILGLIHKLALYSGVKDLRLSIERSEFGSARQQGKAEITDMLERADAVASIASHAFSGCRCKSIEFQRALAGDDSDRRVARRTKLLNARNIRLRHENRSVVVRILGSVGVHRALPLRIHLLVAHPASSSRIELVR